jgi:hypothetical protein
VWHGLDIWPRQLQKAKAARDKRELSGKKSQPPKVLGQKATSEKKGQSETQARGSNQEQAPGKKKGNSEKKEHEAEQTGIIPLRGGAVLDLNEGCLRVPGRLCNPSWPIEVFACAEGSGKEHEAIITTKVDPWDFYLSLVALGLNCGNADGKPHGPKFFGDPTPPVGDRVVVLLEWKDKQGKTVSYRGEDLLLYGRTGDTMPQVGWVFSGSVIDEERDPETGKPTGVKIRRAIRQRILIAVYHDPGAIVDNPIPEGGAKADELYHPNAKVLPPGGTEAVLVIRPPTKEEKQEMQKELARITRMIKQAQQRAARKREKESDKDDERKSE